MPINRFHGIKLLAIGYRIRVPGAFGVLQAKKSIRFVLDTPSAISSRDTITTTTITRARSSYKYHTLPLSSIPEEYRQDSTRY